MTILNHLQAFTGHVGPVGPRYAVALIDRCTGRPHMIAGIPLVVMTRAPDATSREMMQDRDPHRWGISVERMDN